MAKKCVVTGKSGMVGGKYSNRVRATQYNPTGKKRRKANIQKKRVLDSETGKTYRINISTKGMKILNKKGVNKTLKEAGVIK